MTFSNFKDTKNIEDFGVENIMETDYESENENPPRQSEAGKLNACNKP